MFEFKKENQGGRSEFANDICKLVVKSNDNDILKSLDNIEKVYDHCFEWINNIYELVSGEIPLFALYELNKYGADNWDFTEKEYKEAFNRTLIACGEFYIN